MAHVCRVREEEVGAHRHHQREQVSCWLAGCCLRERREGRCEGLRSIRGEAGTERGTTQYCDRQPIRTVREINISHHAHMYMYSTRQKNVNKSTGNGKGTTVVVPLKYRSVPFR